MSWNILRRKTYETLNPKPEEIISIKEWQTYVENDIELLWAENSPIADAYRNEGEIWVKDTRLKHNAYYELNKSGYGNLRFKFFEHYISIDCERQTLKRINKMKEVTNSLNGILFKNGIRYTEKKFQKLLDKYQNKKK